MIISKLFLMIKPLNFSVLAFLGIFMLDGDVLNIPYNKDTNKIEYEEIFENSNKSENELYLEMRDWLIVNNMPIILSDSTASNNRRIISEKIFQVKYGNYSIFSTGPTKEYGIQYSLIIDFKDHKIRCKVININFLEYKYPTATGLWGYGIVTAKVKEKEILSYPAETFYPIEKNERKYRDMYRSFFTTINEDIVSTLNGIEVQVNSSKEDW